MEQMWQREDFERDMLALIQEKQRYEDHQWEAAFQYTLKNGGKRFRPQVVYACCADLGLSKRTATVIGTAVEIIHTASLIHDDLPSIDNDTMRRGKPTSHVVYGEAIATVSADYLFFLGMEIALDTHQPEIGTLYAQCAMDTCYGEALDIRISLGKENHTIEDLLRMYEMKTGRLIQFSLLAPFLVSGIQPSLRSELWEAGRRIGLAFQILDDLKDIYGSFAELGKTPGKDLLQNKPTIVAFEGPEKALERAFLNWDLAKCILENGIDGYGFPHLVETIAKSWEILQKR